MNGFVIVLVVFASEPASTPELPTAMLAAGVAPAQVLSRQEALSIRGESISTVRNLLRDLGRAAAVAGRIGAEVDRRRNIDPFICPGKVPCPTR